MAIRGNVGSVIHLALNVLPNDVLSTKRHVENIQLLHESLGKGQATVVVAEAGLGFVLLSDQRTALHSYRDIHHVEVETREGKGLQPETKTAVVLSPHNDTDPDVVMVLSDRTSLLTHHVMQAWLNYTLRKCINLPISTSVDTPEAVRTSVNQLITDLTCLRSEQWEEKGSLLREFADAAIHDKTMKSLFFTSELFGFVLRELRNVVHYSASTSRPGTSGSNGGRPSSSTTVLRQRTGSAASSVDHPLTPDEVLIARVEYFRDLLSLLHSVLFNSEGTPTRSKLLHAPQYSLTEFLSLLMTSPNSTRFLATATVTRMQHHRPDVTTVAHTQSERVGTHLHHHDSVTMPVTTTMPSVNRTLSVPTVISSVVPSVQPSPKSLHTIQSPLQQPTHSPPFNVLVEKPSSAPLSPQSSRVTSAQHVTTSSSGTISLPEHDQGFTAIVSATQVSDAANDDTVTANVSLMMATTSLDRVPAQSYGAVVRERARVRRQQRLEQDERLAGESSEDRVRLNIARATARMKEERLSAFVASTGTVTGDNDVGSVFSDGESQSGYHGAQRGSNASSLDGLQGVGSPPFNYDPVTPSPLAHATQQGITYMPTLVLTPMITPTTMTGSKFTFSGVEGVGSVDGGDVNSLALRRHPSSPSRPMSSQFRPRSGSNLSTGTSVGIATHVRKATTAQGRERFAAHNRSASLTNLASVLGNIGLEYTSGVGISVIGGQGTSMVGQGRPKSPLSFEVGMTVPPSPSNRSVMSGLSSAVSYGRPNTAPLNELRSLDANQATLNAVHEMLIGHTEDMAELEARMHGVVMMKPVLAVDSDGAVTEDLLPTQHLDFSGTGTGIVDVKPSPEPITVTVTVPSQLAVNDMIPVEQPTPQLQLSTGDVPVVTTETVTSVTQSLPTTTATTTMTTTTASLIPPMVETTMLTVVHSPTVTDNSKQSPNTLPSPSPPRPLSVPTGLMTTGADAFVVKRRRSLVVNLTALPPELVRHQTTLLPLSTPTLTPSSPFPALMRTHSARLSPLPQSFQSVITQTQHPGNSGANTPIDNDISPPPTIPTPLVDSVNELQLGVLLELSRLIREIALTKPADLRSHRSLGGFMSEVDLHTAQSFVETLLKMFLHILSKFEAPNPSTGPVTLVSSHTSAESSATPTVADKLDGHTTVRLFTCGRLMVELTSCDRPFSTLIFQGYQPQLRHYLRLAQVFSTLDPKNSLHYLILKDLETVRRFLRL